MTMSRIKDTLKTDHSGLTHKEINLKHLVGPAKLLKPAWILFYLDVFSFKNSQKTIGFSHKPESFICFFRGAEMTDDFFRSRLDCMIDPRHPLAVLADKLPWSKLEASIAPIFAHHPKPVDADTGFDFASEFVKPNVQRSSQTH